jgi:hypothetical protein
MGFTEVSSTCHPAPCLMEISKQELLHQGESSDWNSWKNRWCRRNNTNQRSGMTGEPLVSMSKWWRWAIPSHDRVVVSTFLLVGSLAGVTRQRRQQAICTQEAGYLDSVLVLQSAKAGYRIATTLVYIILRRLIGGFVFLFCVHMCCLATTRVLEG